MEETCEILDHDEILKGFITNANYEGFKAYIESDEFDIRTINSLVGGSILLFFSEIHSEIHSNHNEEDMKNIIKMYDLLLESPFVDVNYRNENFDSILKDILITYPRYPEPFRTDLVKKILTYGAELNADDFSAENDFYDLPKICNDMSDKGVEIPIVSLNESKDIKQSIIDLKKSEFKKEKTFKRRKDELERTLETLKDTSEEHYLSMDDIIKENDLIMETIVEINDIIFDLKVDDEKIEKFFEELLESLTTIKDMGVSTNESKRMRKYSSIEKIKKMIIGDKENYRQTQLTLFSEVKGVTDVTKSSNLSRLKKLRRINKVYKTDDLIQLKKLKEIFKYLETNTTIKGDRLDLLLDPDEYKEEEFVDKDYDDMTKICKLNKLLLPGNSTTHPEPLSGYGFGSGVFHAINKNTETAEMLCMLTTKTIQHKEFLSVLLDELIMMMEMRSVLDLENLKRPVVELMKEERGRNDLDKILVFASKLSFFEPFLNKNYLGQEFFQVKPIYTFPDYNKQIHN